jgi:hypothetical protein
LYRSTVVWLPTWWVWEDGGVAVVKLQVENKDPGSVGQSCSHDHDAWRFTAKSPSPASLIVTPKPLPQGSNYMSVLSGGSQQRRGTKCHSSRIEDSAAHARRKVADALGRECTSAIEV